MVALVNIPDGGRSATRLERMAGIFLREEPSMSVQHALLAAEYVLHLLDNPDTQRGGR